jgi:hypothetical protein
MLGGDLVKLIPEGSLKSQRFLSISITITVSAILVSALQGVFFAIDAPWTTYTVLVVFLAATNLSLAIRYLSAKDTRLFELTLILYCAQLSIFAFYLVGLEPPVSLRLLQVAIATVYIATVMAVLLTISRIVTPVNAVLLSFSLWAGIFFCESALELLSSSKNQKEPEGAVSAPLWYGNNSVSHPDWVGGMEFHPSLNLVYGPYSIVKTYYPDNPRGYFEEEDVRHSQWWLRVSIGNVANLTFTQQNKNINNKMPETTDIVRVAIRKAETKDTWGIQLNQAQLRVKENHRYAVNFRARADSPRSIFVGFAKAHEPWSKLGLWKNIELTPEWRSFQEEFVASANEDKARIQFDVGGSDISVEFSDVSLISLPDGERIFPDTPKRYFVSYRFNTLGCRGRDFSIPRPDKTKRILLLGDSYTLGVGVHEQHTVANQLERLLNNNADKDGSAKAYEVINCGVSGYGTRDERNFYQLFGSKYDPDIVLLMMVWNDDSSYWEELQRGEYRSPGRLEYLSYIWAKTQEYRHRRPSPDFSGSVEEIHRLDSEVRRQGARLGVVIYRNECDYQGTNFYSKTWNLLTNTVMEGLKSTDIPILDLGKVLCEKGDATHLIAHPIMDWHPNEVATKLSAGAILSFLRNQELLSQR